MKKNLTNSAPDFAPHAIAKPHGWVDPVTGEVYVAMRLDVEAINKQSGVKAVQTVKQPVVEAVVEQVTEQVVESSESDAQEAEQADGAVQTTTRKRGQK